MFCRCCCCSPQFNSQILKLTQKTFWNTTSKSSYPLVSYHFAPPSLAAPSSFMTQILSVYCCFVSCNRMCRTKRNRTGEVHQSVHREATLLEVEPLGPTVAWTGLATHLERSKVWTGVQTNSSESLLVVELTLRQQPQSKQDQSRLTSPQINTHSTALLSNSQSGK